MEDLLFKDESYEIIGACMEVHRQLGPGFLESVYQEALAMEFGLRGIPFIAQHEVHVYYKDNLMQGFFKPDFLCYENIIVEIKALSALTHKDHAQVLNVLKATRINLGLLINFGEISMKHQRLVNTSKNLRNFPLKEEDEDFS